MCQDNEVERLLRFTFSGLEREFENMLEFRARNSDPLVVPNYHRIYYAYHMRRGNYRAGKSPEMSLGRSFSNVC
jgi:nuclear pore complex protein Nup160